MAPSAPIASRSELVRVLRRAGYPADVIDEITGQLHDPIDADRDRYILERYGVTQARLMNAMGASP